MDISSLRLFKKKNARLVLQWVFLEPVRLMALVGFSIATVKVNGITTLNANSPLIGILIGMGIYIGI